MKVRRSRTTRGVRPSAGLSRNGANKRGARTHHVGKAPRGVPKHPLVRELGSFMISLGGKACCNDGNQQEKQYLQKALCHGGTRLGFVASSLPLLVCSQHRWVLQRLRFRWCQSNSCGSTDGSRTDPELEFCACIKSNIYRFRESITNMINPALLVSHDRATSEEYHKEEDMRSLL